jgi:hypothetical protein
MGALVGGVPEQKVRNSLPGTSLNMLTRSNKMRDLAVQ